MTAQLRRLENRMNQQSRGFSLVAISIVSGFSSLAKKIAYTLMRAWMFEKICLRKISSSYSVKWWWAKVRRGTERQRRRESRPSWRRARARRARCWRPRCSRWMTLFPVSLRFIDVLFVYINMDIWILLTHRYWRDFKQEER